MQRPLLALLLASTLLAGCLSGSSPSGAAAGDPDAGDPSASAPPLPEAARDWSFGAPQVLARGSRGSFLASIGEPSIAAAPDGSLYVVFTGCDNGLPYIGLADAGLPDPSDTCPAPILHRSMDGGASWQRVNGPDGRLAAQAGDGYGDAIVRTDALGRVYVLAMGVNTLELQRSDDGGATWIALGNVASTVSPDRPWLDARGDGQLALVWRDNGLQMRLSHDAGASWGSTIEAAPGYHGDGQVRFDATGQTVLVPYRTQSSRTLQVARVDVATLDVQVVDAVLLPEPRVGTASPGPVTLMHLAVDGTGRVALVWDQEGWGSVVSVARGHTKLVASFSDDAGLTWSPAQDLPNASRMMPWVAGLAEGGFAVPAYYSPVLGNSEYVGVWSLEVQRLGQDGRVLLAPADAEAHVGGICTEGTNCPVFGSDRSLLDLIEAVQGPDGRVHVAYTADPVGDGKQVQVRVVSQA